jgi:hypothetical protein
MIPFVIVAVVSFAAGAAACWFLDARVVAAVTKAHDRAVDAVKSAEARIAELEADVRARVQAVKDAVTK